MSRETNSILLRYSMNTFWSNSISSDRKLYSFQQYESFLNLFLKNYFLKKLKVQYKINLIHVYIFYYKEEKLSFNAKWINWRKLQINQIDLRKNYNITYTKSKKKYSRKYILKNILNIHNKLKTIKYIFNILKKQSTKNFNYISFNHANKWSLKNIFNNSKISRKKKSKLKKINSFLKLKWLSIVCSNVLKLYSQKYNKIVFEPAFKKISYSRMPFLFKYMKFNLLKKKLYNLLTGLLYFQASIINIYVSDIIKKTKNKKHIKNLAIFFNTIKIFFNKQIIPFNGFKFFISGRLNGKLRKGSFGFKLGSIKLMSFDTSVNYSCDIVYTQYGTFSLKSWLCDNIIK